MTITRLSKSVALTLSFLMIEVPFALNSAHAGMIPTSDAVTSMAREQKREKVAAFLKRDDVRKELVRFGVQPAEADMRVASMTDTELQQMDYQIDHAVAGGDVIVIGLGTVLVVLLILLLLGRI